MKYINNKITLAICIALSLSACSPNKTADEYLKSSQDLVAQNKINAATIELKNAIKADPNNATIRFSLGQIYFDQGDLLLAIKELQKALQNNSLIDDVVPLLAQAYQQNNEETELLELEEFLPELKDASKLQLYVFTSILYSQKNNTEKAQEYLTKASTLSEDNVYSQLANAWLNKSQQKLDDALNATTEIIKSNPKMSSANLLKGHLLFAKGQYNEAAKSYSNYALKHPKKYQVKMFLANSLVAAGENKKADDVLNGLIKLFPKHPFVNQLKAQLSYAEGNYEQTKEFANIALQSTESPMAKLLLGLSAYQLKEYELAYQSLRTVVLQLPKSHSVQKIFASLQLQLGYQNEALSSFNEIEGLSSNDVDFLKSASQSFARLGNTKEAEKLIDKALDINPENADLVMQKGMIKLKEQDRAGLELLEKSLSMNPELKVANITLAIQYLSSNRFKDAMEVAKKWQKTDSGKIQGKLLEGVIFTRQLNFEQAKNVFLNVLELDHENISANYYLGLITLNDQNFEGAIQYFKNILESHPSHYGALQYLIWSALSSSKQSALEQFFIDLRQKFPQSLALILGQATNYSTQGKFQAAIDFLNKYQKSELVNQDYWMALADLYERNQQPENAKNIYNKLLSENINNLKVRMSLLALYVKQQNFEAVLLEVNKGIETSPNNLRYKAIKAKYSLKLNKLNDAEFIIANLVKKLPLSISIKRLQAELSFRKKDYKKAILILADVYHTDKNAHHLLEYIKALRANHDEIVAIKEMKEFLQKTNDTLVRVALAQLLIENSPQKALDEYYDLLQKMPDNVVLLNNIAIAELSLNRNNNALNHAKRANLLAPHNPKVIDTYALTLKASGYKEKALKYFEMAYNLAKNNDEIVIHYGESLAELGRRKELQLLLSQFSLTNKQLTERYKKLKILIK